MDVYRLPAFIVLGLSYSDGLSWQRQPQVSTRINACRAFVLRTCVCVCVAVREIVYGFHVLVFVLLGVSECVCVCVAGVICSHTSRIKG